MLITSPMKYIKLFVLDKDFKKTLDLLGEIGWVEIKRNKNEDELTQATQVENERLDKLENQISHIFEFLGFPFSDHKGELTDIEQIETFFNHFEQSLGGKKEQYQLLLEKKTELENSIKEIERYKNLDITREELKNLSFLHYVIGSILPHDLEVLNEKMKGRIICQELNEDIYIIFTSKKGKWTLESELKKLSFKEKEILLGEKELASQIYQNLTAELVNIDRQIKEIDQLREKMGLEYGDEIKKYAYSFNLFRFFNSIYSDVQHTNNISLIEGWVKQNNLPGFKKRLEECLKAYYSIISYSPSELEEVRTGRIKVPVVLSNIKFFRPFEEIIYGYGSPKYGTLNPTVFVAFSFLILFGLMFGDMGQGLIILLLGLFLKTKGKEQKIRNAGYILASVGLFAIFFGYLYGAAFCFEHHEIGHLFTPINKALFGIDKPFILDTSSDKIFNLFYLTVGYGIIINIIGILINITNHLINRKLIHAVLGHNGFLNLVIFVCIGIMAFQMVVLKQAFNPLYMYIIAACFGLMFFREPLESLAEKKPLFHDGFGIWLLTAIVEVFEAFLQAVTNNLSFIRVGAFAFAHVLLSSTVIALVFDLGGGLKSIGGIIILIIGNLFIIVLEGMIVSIQTIRLEYYEFFSKFFTEQGKKFKPFKIEKYKSNESP